MSEALEKLKVAGGSGEVLTLRHHTCLKRMQYIFIEFTKRHVIATKLQITIVSKSGAIPIFIFPIGMKDVEWVVSSSMIFVKLQNKSVLNLFKTVATSS